MRILFWSETFWPRIGGVENLAARLLPALQNHGHEFIVVTWEHVEMPDQIHYRGIPVFRFPFFSAGPEGSLTSFLEYRRRVAALKKDFAPELVHVNSFGRSVLFHLETAVAYPAPTLVTLHQALPDEPIGRRSLLENLLSRAAWVTCCSQSVLDHARRLWPEITLNSSVIHNAIELTEGEPRAISFDPPRILCLGRLVWEKGFDLALEAVSIVSRRFPETHVIIAGEGSELDNLKRQTRNLGLTDHVEFAGKIVPDQVAHWITTATLALVPSRLEGFGLVALEAGSFARPVVATRVGGLPEIIVHEETGLLTECGNSAALAGAVESLLAQPKRANRMGVAARQRVQEKFDWTRYVNTYDALYRHLCSDMNDRTGHQSHAAR